MRTWMKPVSTSPRTKASFAASRPRNSRFVEGPTTWYSFSALRSARRAEVRSSPRTISFDRSGS